VAGDGRAAAALGVGVSTKDTLRLWLRLLVLTNMIEGRVRRRLRAAFGITLPRFDVMAALCSTPEGLSMGELSHRLMVSNGNVTGIVERLECEGLVRRRQRPEDRRSHLVRLTDAGREAFEAMAAEHENWIASMLSELSEEEVEQLYHLLNKAKRSILNGDGEED
jgi:DNA-binding MarR family transcriptional regulator